MGTFTLSQIETRVYDQLDNNTGEFPAAQVIAVINQGLYRLNNLVGFSQATVPVPGFSVANQIYYATPSSILIPLSCDFEGTRLEPYSLRRLGREYQNFATDSNWPQRWVRMGMKNFLIHPADSVGGGMLEITGVAALSPLVNPNDTCQLEDWHVEIVVNWSKARLLLKEGGKAWQDMTLVLQKMYKQAQVKSLWQNISFPKYWILERQAESKGTRAGLVPPQVGA